MNIKYRTFFAFSLFFIVPFICKSVDYDFSSEASIGCGNEVSDLAIGPDGSWHAVWTSMSDGHVHYNKRSAGGGWDSPEQIPYSNDWGWQFNRARIAVGSDGVIHVVWGNSAHQEIYYSMRFPGSSWWIPRVVYSTSASPGCSKPSVAAQFGGVAHVLFERHYSSHIAIAYRQITNGSMGNLLTVSNYSYDNGDPNAEIGPDGSLHAVWITGGSSYIRMHYRQRYTSGFWSSEEVLEHPGGAGGPDVSISPGGTPYLSWISYMRNGNGWYINGVYYAARTGSGWTNNGAGERVSPGTSIPEEGSVEVVSQGAFNSQGDYMLVWPSANSMQYRILSEGVWNEVREMPAAAPRFWINVEGAGSKFAIAYGNNGRCLFGREAYRSVYYEPPQILAAGFMETDLRNNAPGSASIIAVIHDPEGSGDLAEVKAWLGDPSDNVPLALLYDDGKNDDFSSGDSVFGCHVYREVWSGGSYFVTITAKDRHNLSASTWPFLTIKPSGDSTGDSEASSQFLKFNQEYSGSAPKILLAGYMFSDLSTGSSSQTLDILAWAVDAQGNPAEKVTIFYQQSDTTFELRDDGTQNDGNSGDGFFALHIPLPPHSLDGAAGAYLFELAAWNGSGEHGALWPYLNVRNQAFPTPNPSPTPTPGIDPNVTPKPTITFP